MIPKTKFHSKLFYIGWITFFALAPHGNTSLGTLMLFFNFIYELSKGKRNFYIPRSSPYILLGAFFILMIITSIPAIRPDLAIMSTLGFFLFITVAFFEGKELCKEKDFLYKSLVPILLASAAFSGLYSSAIYLLGISRRGHVLFLGTNAAGTILAACVVIGLSYYDHVYQQKKSISYPVIGQVAFITSGLVLTFSRGGWLGAMIGASSYSVRSKIIRYLLLISLIILMVVFFSSESLQNRFLSIFSLDRNSDRLNIWEVSIDMMAEYAIFGAGTGMFAYHWGDFIEPDNRIQAIAYAHNIFIQLVVDFGLLGLILFSLLIANIIYVGIKNMKNQGPIYGGFLSAFIAILIHQQVDCTIYGLEITGLFWVLGSLIINIPISSSHEKENSDTQDHSQDTEDNRNTKENVGLQKISDLN